MEVVIGVRGEDERRQAGLLHGNAQFLVQFADYGVVGRFVGLDLATGKFPQARHGLALRPLRQQHPALVIDQCGSNDQNGFHRKRPLSSKKDLIHRRGNREI